MTTTPFDPFRQMDRLLTETLRGPGSSVMPMDLYRDGVLTLTIPVAEEAKPRKVSVSHSSQPKAVESKAS